MIKPANKPTMARQQPGSFMAQITALEVGECASKSQALDMNRKLTTLEADMSAARRAISNTVTKAIQRAGEATGGSYAYEVADVITPTRRFYVVAIITRNA